MHRKITDVIKVNIPFITIEVKHTTDKSSPGANLRGA